MEAIRSRHDDCLVVRHPFVDVRPLPGEFKRCFDTFRTSVHRKDHVIAKVLVNVPSKGELHFIGKSPINLLTKTGEHVIVERAGRESTAFALLYESLDDLGMTMSLVHSRISGQEVQVPLSLWIPSVDSLSTFKYHLQRLVTALKD